VVNGVPKSFQHEQEKDCQSTDVGSFRHAAAETIVSCDASGIALGACLSQKVGGVERPIAFASRVLSTAERKCSVSESQAIACLWARERWNSYLYGRRFTLVTDHKASKTMLTNGGSGHRPLRLHRWCDRSFTYTFDVVYRPGRDHCVPGFLSRSFNDDESTLPISQEGDIAGEDLEDHVIGTIFGPIGTNVTLK